MSNESYNWKDAKIGALWAKQRQDGSTAYNGKITIDGKDIFIHVFPSKFAGETPGSPALTIHLSPPPRENSNSAPQAQPAQAQRPAAAPRQNAAPRQPAPQPAPRQQYQNRPAQPAAQATVPQQAQQPHDVTL